MSGPAGTELFITSDMFFVEILLETTGVVKDVKIHHEGKTEQQVSEVPITLCVCDGEIERANLLKRYDRFRAGKN